MAYIEGRRTETGEWIAGHFACDKPCPTHHMCRVVSDKVQLRGQGVGPGFCHWTDHAPGWHDLSRTGKLIWLHAWKTEPRKQS